MGNKSKMSEATLQTHVCKLLTAFGRHDICWFAIPNGEARSPKTGQRLKQQGVRAGAADLGIVVDNLFHGIELKTETGAQSKAQAQFQEDLTRAGGVYHLAHGLDEAVAVLKDIEAFLPNINISSSGS